MTKPLLLLDCYLDESGCARHFDPLGRDGPVVLSRPSWGEQVPARARDYSGVVVTGSAASVLDGETHPWIASVEALMVDALRSEVPTLGVCFGHQLLAKAAFGDEAVRRSATPEIGWFAIDKAGEHPLLEGFQPRFETFLSHFDEVVPGTPGMEVLASSARCEVQAFEVVEKPAWGVQFHAEMDAEETERLLRTRAAERPELGIDLEAQLASAVDSTPLRDMLLTRFAGWARRTY